MTDGQRPWSCGPARLARGAKLRQTASSIVVIALRELQHSSSERFGKVKIMNRDDKPAYRPPSFPVEPMDMPRRKIPPTDCEQGEDSSQEEEAAISEGWPVSPRSRFGSRKRRAGETDRQ